MRPHQLVRSHRSQRALGTPITNDSLSVGEKQLLCICRALLKQSKVVLIDEATVNINTKNDQMIQRPIDLKFVSSMVLTIAHRLTTLGKMVLGKGEVLEWGARRNCWRKRKGSSGDVVGAE